MQQSGGLLLAGFHPGDTLIFAIGENANESLPAYRTNDPLFFSPPHSIIKPQSKKRGKWL